MATAGAAGLQSGPMIGYVDMFEALVWVQTKGNATVHIEYWEQDKPETKYKTDPVKAMKPAFTAKCIANKTQPGKSYSYEVYINQKKVELNYPTTFRTQTQWQWRTDPPPSLSWRAAAFHQRGRIRPPQTVRIQLSDMLQNIRKKA